jgi:hypothetical protein
MMLHELNITDSGVENGLMDSESDWRGKFYNNVFKNGRLPRALIFQDYINHNVSRLQCIALGVVLSSDDKHLTEQ